jgi:amidase
LVAAAIGSDGAGSVRIPAAWTHLVGIKPQRGRISTWPLPEAFNGITVNGVLARTVADAALVLNVIAGCDGLDPRQPADLVPADYLAALAQDAAGLRIGVVSEGFGHPNSEPGVDAAVRASVDVLRSAG